ncbi:MAG TPA: PAS domain S-box protein [Smithellaceae bacterium]|nr:PAS domain S-box protein [Smithellaceae bacterium]
MENLKKVLNDGGRKVFESDNLSPRVKVGLSSVSSDDIYRMLFRMSPYMILLTRLGDGEIYDVSDVFCQVIGFKREESIGKTTVQLGLWPDQDRGKMVKVLLRDGGFRNMEIRHRKKDGAIVSFLVSGELLLTGNEHYVLSVSVDVTERKDLESKLLSMQAFNDAAINSMPGLFYVVDENFRFLQWNESLPNITGYTNEEIRDMQVLDLHSEEMRLTIAEEIKKVFQKGEHTAEASMRLKDGSVKIFLFNSKSMRYQGKNCVIGTATDITELKQAEKEMTQFAKNLEDANTALRILMQHRDMAQKETEAKLQANINDLVIPYLKKLQKAYPDERYRSYLNILEQNLRNALSPFMKDFLSFHTNLTTQEIHIIDLIKKGKNTSEIAAILSSSAKTVATHRNNIRKKLNLVNSKTNLRSYLQSSWK